MDIKTLKENKVRLSVGTNSMIRDYTTGTETEGFNGRLHEVELHIPTIHDAKSIVVLCGYTHWAIYKDIKGTGWSSDYEMVEASPSVMAWDKAEARKKAKADREKRALVAEINASLKSKVVYDKVINGKRFTITVKRDDVSMSTRGEVNVQFFIKHGTQTFDSWAFLKYESKRGAILKRRYMECEAGSYWDTNKDKKRKTKEAKEFVEYLGGIIRAINENKPRAIYQARGLK